MKMWLKILFYFSSVLILIGVHPLGLIVFCLFIHNLSMDVLQFFKTINHNNTNE